MKALYAIAMAAVGASSGPVVKAGILAGPLTNAANGHIYYLLNTNTWTGAEAEAIRLGGHLVSFSDTNENHWVCTNFSNYGGVTRGLWIGLSDVQVPGRWEWVSGEPVTFFNWRPRQPNNNTTFGPQHWGMIWPPGDGVPLHETEQWNDYWDVPVTIDQAILEGLHGVVEVHPKSTNAVPLAAATRAIEISFASISNQWYRVEWAPEAESNSWMTFGPYIIGHGSTIRIYDSIGAVQRKFYRVVPVER